MQAGILVLKRARCLLAAITLQHAPLLLTLYTQPCSSKLVQKVYTEQIRQFTANSSSKIYKTLGNWSAFISPEDAECFEELWFGRMAHLKPVSLQSQLAQAPWFRIWGMERKGVPWSLISHSLQEYKCHILSHTAHSLSPKINPPKLGYM